MNNHNIEIAWHYHDGTKHPNGMLLNRFHFYNPAIRPIPYKIYKDLRSITVPLDKSESFLALKAICTDIKAEDKSQIPDLPTLARILYFSAGITKTIRYPGLGDLEFRAAACTGALFHIEIYVVCKDLPGLQAGVYHFDPKEMKLVFLRKGDYRGLLAQASGYDTSVKYAPLILVFTDIFTRNSVKYQAREYRHAFWDCGTILANTLAICSAHGLTSKVIMGFVDDVVTSLLDLRAEKEATLALVPIGFTKGSSQMPTLEPLDYETEPLSNYDYDDPEILKMHRSSSLSSVNQVKEWHAISQGAITSAVAKKVIELTPVLVDKLPINSIESVIIKRGSPRIFSRESISFEQLSTIIYYSTRGLSADFLQPYGSTLIDLYMIVNAVDGLSSGSYYYDRERNGLELLRKGMFRTVAGNLGLDQNLSADGSVAVFFMSDLNVVLKRFGNRGYRAAQLEASITGGRFYLASYAQKLGATGLTFYDDSVTNFFSPHAKEKSVMFMVVIGKKPKK